MTTGDRLEIPKNIGCSYEWLMVDPVKLSGFHPDMGKPSITYPLVNVYITMVHHHAIIYRIKNTIPMSMFNSYLTKSQRDQEGNGI